jgi:hypothetical protein
MSPLSRQASYALCGKALLSENVIGRDARLDEETQNNGYADQRSIYGSGWRSAAVVHLI